MNAFARVQSVGETTMIPGQRWPYYFF